MDVGTRVRSLIELLADNGEIVPAGRRGIVVGNAGDRPVVDFEDGRTVECNRWEVRAIVPERVTR